MIEVSIIIPTYNEAKNLPLLTSELFSVVDRSKVDLELIIVDDNSPDGTGQVAEDLAKNLPVKVIHRSGKLGLGSAVREGFALSKRPILGVMDADLSHDPIIINEMIANLATYDIVIGSRFESGSAVENWTIPRKIISQTGVWLAQRIAKVSDPLSGYFFIKSSVLSKVKLEVTGYKILMEILVKVSNVKIKEIPFHFRMRQYSTSKLDFKECLYFAKQLVIYSWFKLMHKF